MDINKKWNSLFDRISIRDAKPLFHGLLHKRGGLNTGWVPRLFVLCSDQSLRYYGSDTNEWGRIDLNRCTKIEYQDGRKECFISIYTLTRSWKLSTDPENLVKWKKVLGERTTEDHG